MTIYAIFLWLFILHVFSFASCFALQKPSIGEQMQRIPREDLPILDRFFRELLFQKGFAYTLFGDKPISLDCFDLENLDKPDPFATSSEGYRTWEKYAHLFQGPHYLFLFYEDPAEALCELTLVNKRAFHQIISEHREKFAAFFGPNVSSEELLNLLIQKRSLWNTPMKERDDLIGILLGYGKNNADLFQRRSEIWGRKKKLSRNREKPSPGYHSVEEESQALNATLSSFSGERKITLSYMQLPSFVADRSHRETIQLKKKYTKQRKKMTALFSHRDALRTALEQFCAQEP